MADDQWWYDLNTKTAVQDNKAGRATDRLGPYASREEAEHAMERVAGAQRGLRQRPALERRRSRHVARTG